MKKLPWKTIGIACLVLVGLVLVRVAVSLGRARYWSQNLLSAVQKDPWVYVGFAALAVAIIAWTMLPSHPASAPDAQIEEVEE